MISFLRKHPKNLEFGFSFLNPDLQKTAEKLVNERVSTFC